MSSEFAIKDSGVRQEFAGGMMRDTTEGKTNFLSIRFGPMFRRWADHLTKGRVKYPDASPGTPNWTLAQGEDEYLRAKESAARHFESWLAGERDEDHAAGVFFNIDVAEYVLEQTELDPALGARVVASGCEDCVDESEGPIIIAGKGVFSTAPNPMSAGRLIEYTPQKGGCDAFDCQVPGAHAGEHVY